MAGEWILIADRSVAVQEIAKNVLEEAGYKVTIASNGLAALTHPELNKIDLLLVDAGMEGVSGYDATRAVKTDADHFVKPVMLLIPEEEEEKRASQSLYGADGYILKPFKPETLIIKVTALLDAKAMRIRARQFIQESADKFQSIQAHHLNFIVVAGIPVRKAHLAIFEL